MSYRDDPGAVFDDEPAGPVCSECGHEHAGPDVAFICIGCPCPHYPPAFDHDDGTWYDCPVCQVMAPCPVMLGGGP